MAHHTAARTDPKMQACIDDCLGCYATCETTTTHCLELGGKHAEPTHIRLLADCARICLVSADFMVRQSGSHARLCAICADVCRECADDCERIDASDEMMAQCAAECRRCADSCAEMAA
jgi:hypothetical protein